MILSLSSLLAVSIITGTSEKVRISMQASLPDLPGIIQSKMMRSKLSRRARSTAVTPS